jgi:hypothetical protein
MRYDGWHGSSKDSATINITAGDGEELGNMLAAIMQLAGVHKVEPGHLGAEPPPATVTAEPVTAVGPSSAGDEMRSVIDKLNPPEGEEDGEEVEDEGIVGGLAGGALGAELGGPMGAMSGYSAGSKATDDLFGGDKEDESYDNTPADPTDKNEFDANQHAGVANQAGSPGADKNRNFKNNPRASTMEQITANLFAEYQDFLKETN